MMSRNVKQTAESWILNIRK